MKALVFLAVRSVVNGIKRALFDVRRLLGLLITIGYFSFVILQPFRAGRGSSQPLRSPIAGRFELPSPDQLQPFLFIGFAALSFMLSLGIFGGKVIHRAGDVDVLFPTPVSPKLVLAFNVAREYLFTLFTPLLLALFGGRYSLDGVQTLFRSFPEHGSHVLRFTVVAWLLLALGWTFWTFALRIYMNRDWKRDKLVRWAVGLAVMMPQLLVMVYFSVQFRTSELAELKADLMAPAIQGALWPAAVGTELAMAPLRGDFLRGSLGAAGLLLFVLSGLGLMMSQTQYVYDQAATRGSESGNIRNLQRQGDTFGILAEYARKGKIKRNKVSRWISEKTVSGGFSFIWREGVLQFRGGIWQYVALFIGAFALTAVATTGGTRSARGAETLFLIMQGLGTFMLASAGSQIGFIETLKRIDVLKPLPFTPGRTVLWEVVAKSVIAGALSAFLSLAAIAFQIRFWDEGLAMATILPTYAFALCGASFLATILFPDIDDPTQRSLRGMVSMLASVIATLPGLLVVVGLVYNKASILWAPLVVVPINLAVGYFATVLAGNFFANYNPSE